MIVLDVFGQQTGSRKNLEGIYTVVSERGVAGHMTLLQHHKRSLCRVGSAVRGPTASQRHRLT
jgi:hypothetical protein